MPCDDRVTIRLPEGALSLELRLMRRAGPVCPGTRSSAAMRDHGPGRGRPPVGTYIIAVVRTGKR